MQSETHSTNSGQAKICQNCLALLDLAKQDRKPLATRAGNSLIYHYYYITIVI
jgi:hypothetical protein